MIDRICVDHFVLLRLDDWFDHLTVMVMKITLKVLFIFQKLKIISLNKQNKQK